MRLDSLSNRAFGGIAGGFLLLSIIAAIGIPKWRYKAPVPVPAVPADFSVRLERTPGSANIVPSYTIEFRPDGSFTPNEAAGGRGMAALEGARSRMGQTSPENLKILFAEAFTQELLGLPEELPCARESRGGDTVRISLSMNGASRRFVHNVGCEDRPDERVLAKLTRFEVMLEQITQSPLCRFVPAFCQLR